MTDFPNLSPIEGAPDEVHLMRYCAGQATLAERAAIDAWAAADEAHRTELEAAQAAWTQSERALVEADTEPLLARLHAAMDEDARTTSTNTVSKAPNSRGARRKDSHVYRMLLWVPQRRRRVLGLSGILALGMAALVARSDYTKHRPSDRARARVHTRAYTTAPNQRKTIALADGSIVVLAPQSQLTLIGNFGRSARNVVLTGQAYFTVQSSPIPFLVRTGAVTTRVLGTVFDVRHYANDVDTRVAVVQGRVAVAGQRQGVVLVAGTVGHVTDSSAMAVNTEDATAAAAWTSGQLVFRRTPVHMVLTGLSHWYGYQFRLNDSTLANQLVTITFDVSDQAGVLAALRHLLNVTMTFDGTSIILTPHPLKLTDSTPGARSASPRWSTSTQIGR